MAAEQPSTDKQIEVQIERLAESHGDERSPEEIARLARESAAELEKAPIQDFVPNLVYNDVKSKLVESGKPADTDVERAPEPTPEAS